MLKSFSRILSQLFFGLYIKYNNNQAVINSKIVTGIAKINQSANEISSIAGKIILTIRAKDKFGGVPTSVEIPPIDAEYAIPKSKPIEYFPILTSPKLSSSFIIIERAIGTIIIAVAVFDIHIERKEVANIKPSKILPGLIPNNKTQLNLFEKENPKHQILMKTLDFITKKEGPNKIKLAVCKSSLTPTIG